MTTLFEISPKLKAWFAPEDHEERKLPGGGKWFFVPWQRIRDRLDEVCPEWGVSYSDPIECGQTGDLNGVIVIRCKLVLCGVTREGVGNSENDAYKDVTEKGGRVEENKKYKGYGTPIKRATADAFKQSAEAFGVGAYLDLQKDQRERFVRYMQKRGDGRAYKAAYDNGWVEGAKPQTRQLERPANLLQVLSSDKKPALPAVETALYPQHNTLIKSIRQATGHSADQIIGWCQSRGAQSPAQLSPDQCEQLAQSLAVSWGKSQFDSEEHCRNSYDGKVKTLVASGMGLGEAISHWIESVQAVPVGQN